MQSPRKLWICCMTILVWSTLDFMKMGSSSMYSFVPGFLDSECFWDSSMQKHVSALPSLILLRSSPLCGYTKFHLLIHLLKDICIVSSFWLLWRRQLWTTFCISLCTDICFQYSGFIPPGGITGFCTVYVYFIRLSKCSPKWLPFYILTGNV